jgi:hypothetical protein
MKHINSRIGREVVELIHSSEDKGDKVYMNQVKYVFGEKLEVREIP